MSALLETYVRLAPTGDEAGPPDDVAATDLEFLWALAVVHYEIQWGNGDYDPLFDYMLTNKLAKHYAGSVGAVGAVGSELFPAYRKLLMEEAENVDDT